MFEDLKLCADIMARFSKWRPSNSYSELFDAARVHRLLGKYGPARFYLAQARAIRIREKGMIH